LLRDGDERLAGSHDDRLEEVCPAACTHDRCCQQSQALAAAGVDLVDLHPQARLDALQVKARE
jgi:hypothetical protein